MVHVDAPQSLESTKGWLDCHVAPASSPLLQLLAGILILLSNSAYVQAGRNNALSSARRILQAPQASPWLMWLIIGCGVVLLLLGAALALWLLRRKASSSAVAPFPKDSPALPTSASRAERAQRRMSLQRVTSLGGPGGPAKFNFEDVQRMTDNFTPSGVVESAGHSSVHKGCGAQGQVLAIKRANRATKEGDHMFKQEVKFLAHVKHPNIVPFVGSCDENQEQILVFEFEPNGSLSSWLRPSDTDDRRPLTVWERLAIACDVAEALRFMHSFTKPNIIHRDVKSDTILLTNELQARLGGLGLLKHLPGEAMRMRMARKKGYLDPEYFQTFKVTAKCDVYSFGVVLLEMITGRPPVIEAEEGNEGVRTTTLAQWALPAVNTKAIERVVDKRLALEGDERAMQCVSALAQVAAACVSSPRNDRPEMEQVLTLLNEIKTSLGLGQ